jgi:branched-chain amino acid transport system permease protein
MATIGLNEFTREMVLLFSGITGGAKGLSFPIPKMELTTLYALYYFAMLSILIIVIATTYSIARSRLGFALLTIRDSEQTAAVIGINTARYKVMAWSISAFFTGLAGGVYGYWVTFIEPSDVFSIITSMKFFTMFLLGGAGTVWGPVIGALSLESLGELIWGRFPEFHLAILGLILLVVVSLLPGGLMSLAKRRSKREPASLDSDKASL